MEFIAIVVVLLGLVIFQQVFFLKQIQKLIDKHMSKSYTEYVHTEKIKEKPKEKLIKVNVNEVPEDLRPLQEFNIFP